jgi:hypothetical protein
MSIRPWLCFWLAAAARASSDHQRRLKGDDDFALLRWSQDRRLRGLAPVSR